MRIEQRQWSPAAGWAPDPPGGLGGRVDLVFVFGAPALLRRSYPLGAIRAGHPGAIVIGCSTAGEIAGTSVSDDSVVATAVSLAASRVRAAHSELASPADSTAAGHRLAEQLVDDDLRHIVVLSDGLHVNGSALVRGILECLPEGIQVTGGLAGDGERFGETLVLLDGEPAPSRIAAVGFYGSGIRVGYGSLGGWDPFGPERLITRSSGNVLYEVDGRPALDLYKTYLGEYASDLPASALLFPLSLRIPGGESGIVRTVLTIDEEERSMTFAGDLPEGCYARLMKANFERLIDGATTAAKTSCEAFGSRPPDLALLISCVGRKMVLRQRIEEEIESVREIFGPRTVLAGFYSYGEISPFTPSARCELHNQTMTITTLSEN